MFDRICKMAARRVLRKWVNDIYVLNFLHDHRNACFQMRGCYDGSMSDECKALFKEQGETTNWLLSLKYGAPEERMTDD